ncbi:MAG: maltose alpha-D-glucosyltransferase / alpha-amylase [Actinomycetota bacterium]|jgi:maltose alpha-D-glucosyltransferase/alpha-amylase|nr:maltose alpha-D-glucosyltransferase / alpha-amylase [Actinomycetota bacterium]
MSERWYKEAVIYCLDVETFQDSNGDGCGDLPGLISRLDYLSRLGVTCLWLNPIYPSPRRDAGYDISDYYAIDPRFGSLGDFAELALEARERGIRILLDLVVNHTSDQHPWFQSARRDAGSPYRGWYVWSESEPADRRQGIVFPGEQRETWTYDDEAKAWYFHRFYDFQPDLDWENRAVREEIKKVMGFWLQLGASGFRVDAAPFVLEMTKPDDDNPPHDFAILDDWRQDLQWRKGDAVLLLEANVEPGDLPSYVAGRPDGPNDRAHMLFNFLLNPRLWLALARQDAEPVVDGLKTAPRLAAMAQWATFLRNHDELDLSRLTKEQQADVFRAFAPKPDMRIYDRGIRRRLAPMLGGDRRRMELAYSLQFTMPGTPVLRYGEEIGMGEDLSLPDRDAIRTPMQWERGATAGFSDADPADLVQPVRTRGRYGSASVNVLDQQDDGDSLLSWFERLIRRLRDCPEIGVGTCTVLDVPLPRPVLAHRFDAPEGSVLFLHNLADTSVTLDLGRQDGADTVVEVFADGGYELPTLRLTGLELHDYGYRWFRLRRGRGD